MLSSETERLKEIYSLLFPNTRVGIVIEIVPNYALYEAVEIPTENAATFLSTGNSTTHHIEINQDKSSIADRYFLIKFCPEPPSSYSGKHSRIPIGIHWTLIFWWRKALMYRYPYLYEIIKYHYLKFFDRKKIKYTRLLNLRNPKNINKKSSIASHENILIGLHWLDVGGAESFAVESTELAHQMGKNIYIVASHLSRPFYKSRLEKISNIYEIDRQIPLKYRLLFINSLIRKHNISLIHNHHSVHVYESLPLLKFNHPDLKVIDSIHIDEKNRFQGGFPRLSIIWSNYIDAHHTISQRLKKLLTSHGVHSDCVLHGHLGKNIGKSEMFSILEAKNKINLCFVGRMSGQKRPLLALKLLIWAVNYCRRNNIQVKVDIVGDGFYLDAFVRVISISGASSYFQMHPANTNVKSILEKADLLLLSSENEGITLVGYEAYSSGTLVVSTDVGAQDELVPDQLLLPASPRGAFQTWKRLFPRIAKDPTFVKQCIEDFHAKVSTIDQSGSAEDLFRTIYGLNQ